MAAHDRLLPFPTELLATSASGDRLTHGLYIGTMFLTTVASTAQQKVIIDHPELQAPELRGTLRLQPSVIAMVTMLFAAIVSVLFASVGLFALFLLLLSEPINRVIDRIRARR